MTDYLYYVPQVQTVSIQPNPADQFQAVQLKATVTDVQIALSDDPLYSGDAYSGELQ